MVELYRLVDDNWCYYGTYDVQSGKDVRSFAEAVWTFGANGFPVKVVKA